MIMNKRTYNVLDIERVLSELHPITPFGIKLKGLMRPYDRKDKEILEEELERIEKIRQLVDTQRAVFVEIRTLMRGIKDIRRSVERCMEGGVLNSVEFFEIKNLISIMHSISNSQSSLHWRIPEKYRVDILEEVEKLLDPEGQGLKTFYIYDCYSDELRELRAAKAKAEKGLEELRQERIREIEGETGLKLRSTGDITISRSQGDLIRKLMDYPRLQIFSDTYINVTFRVRPDESMEVFINTLEDLKEKEALEEMKVLEDLSQRIAAYGENILRNIDAIGNFDLLIAKAYLAMAMNAVKPVISEDICCRIKNGRHPLVEAGLKKKGKVFTPISVNLGKGAAVITGANMGGKSVSLKMVGLLMAMLQHGLFVPAEYMEASLCDFIFISAGDEQSLDSGLSTFGAEMKGIKEMLDMSDQHGLVLIDELARGTNPREGYAISYGIISYMMKKPCITLVTTHFDGLVREGVKHLQVKGLRNVDYERLGDPEVISQYMDYTLIEIVGNIGVPKDAINISRLIGVPETILKEAENILES